MKQLFIRPWSAIKKLNKKRVLLVLVGNFILAVGISNIHAYSGVTEGGAIGLTLLLYHWFGISPAISSFIIDSGCFVLGRHVLGRSFLAYSAIAIVSYSLFYALIEPFAPLWPSILSSPLMCALIGAVFIGVGAGMSVLGGGAAAGDDALAMSLSKHFNFGIQYAYLGTDLIVLLMSLSYIPLHKIAYSLLTVILSGQIIGWIQRLKTD